MTDKEHHAKIKEYFKLHDLETSPCRNCKNLFFLRPQSHKIPKPPNHKTGGFTWCISLSVDEWKRHWRPNGPACDKFEEGIYQIGD